MNARHIYKDSPGGLTRSQIAEFIRATPEERQQILAQTQDAFERDALLGYALHPESFELLKSADRKFYRKTSSGNWKWFVPVGAFAVITVIFILVQRNTISEQQQTISQLGKREVEITIDEADIIPEEIQQLDEINSNEQITRQDLPHPKTEKPHTHKEPLQKPDVSLPVSPVEPLPAQPADKLPEPEAKLVTSRKQAKEYYPEDLKLVDYRAYRSANTVETRQIVMGGTPANLEDDETEVTEDPAWRQVDIPYDEYIRKTLSYFNRANYKKALSRFEVILKTYPDDINALFYGGLCYYNLGDYAQAKTCFSKVRTHSYSNFDEEAGWFLALAQKNSGEVQAARRLLTEISQSGGFYAKQAEALLKK